MIRDISKLSQITYNNFEISLVVFMPNITTNDVITYTYNILMHVVKTPDKYPFNFFVGLLSPSLQLDVGYVYRLSVNRFVTSPNYIYRKEGHVLL